MMKSTYTKILFTALLSLLALSAHAFNLDFLKYSPAYYFTDQDWSIQKKAALRALNKANDGTKISWKNPNTTAWGYVIPSHTTRIKGKFCRSLTIFNSAKSITNQSTFEFCKLNGEWMAIS